jgi:hypothetical protein
MYWPHAYKGSQQVTLAWHAYKYYVWERFVPLKVGVGGDAEGNVMQGVGGATPPLGPPASQLTMQVPSQGNGPPPGPTFPLPIVTSLLR